jgi:BlaI family penicillinase repressor
MGNRAQGVAHRENSSMTKRFHRLSDIEMEVLQALGEHGPSTARQVKRHLPRGGDLSYSTVITVLRRMEAKGYVGHTKAKSGKAFVFHAKLEPDQIRRSVIGSMVKRYFQDDPIPVIAALVETRGLRPDEIEEMRKLLNGMEEDAEGGKEE